MENNTYNGYYNRATWNLMLWIGNDETAYNHFRSLYQRIGGEVIEEREERVQRESREWFGSTTPDGDRLDDVNWLEVTEHLDEDFEEIRREILA
tara:strand:+ start:26 stop:307 length:282 start_codon:yes stop_codon:yes gene_type:complete